MPFYTIKAGCRGNEAQDWAQMLLAMYARWSARNGYSMLSRPTFGKSNGIVEALIMLDCPRKLLAGEIGVHRLVRVSPFDPEHRRHTSFAEVCDENEVSQRSEVLFGSQIRSYVFAPYRLVKDTRTKLEITDVNAVLEGHIEPFIEAYAKLKTPTPPVL